jgi:hypothetical protein
VKVRQFYSIRVDLNSLLALIVLSGLLLCVFPQFAASQSILSRESWNAKPPITQRMKRHRIKEIVIHHIGFPKDGNKSIGQKLRKLQTHAQRNKPWGDIPYHFYIDMHGVIAEGRDLKYAGDTNTGYNPANRIHIVLEGDFNREEPGAKQRLALQSLVGKMRSKYSLPASKVFGHGDRAPTACPGEHLHRLVEVLSRGGTI